MSRYPSILFVNQNYYPDLVSAGQRLTDLAEHLAADGFAVSVLCGRGGYEGESTDAPVHETRNGVQIRRLRTPNFGRSSNLGRITDYAAFFTQALGHVLARSAPDYVVTLTTPPLVNIVGAAAKLLKNQPYGIWSMDLHPDGEKALGMIPEEGLVTSVLDGLNDMAYRKADFVIALGRRMAERIQAKGVRNDSLKVLPMWTKGMDEVPEEQNPYLEKFGLQDRFVVLYAGNAGLFHQFEEICDCMRRFKDHDDIYFLFVGDGPRRDEIESYAREHDIDNFEYRDYVPREDLKYVLSLADVHLLSLRPEISGIAVPSKLYDSMMSARPVLMVGPRSSETARTIEEGEFGVVFDPSRREGTEVVQGLVEALEMFYEKPDQRREMGERGRALYNRKYAQERVCEQWSRFLRDQIDSSC
ncbi:glycosyltransferase family 4 protein [Salinibacter altiplanensis]|uniref:glycosyltransferase family 4 protein n=1 Tax=Salinibacter altiplanensis TaxID=1803181 RepID=UPI000C9ED8F2|nr:glycosyltransferase family 4 protein [Salinibacter altiplanensis]